MQHMRDIDHKPPRQDQAGDELDRILDATLEKYAAVDARPGLEERILANLCSRRMEAPSGARWRLWIAAAVVAVVVLSVAMLWRSPRPSPRTITNQVPASPPIPVEAKKALPNAAVTAVRSTHKVVSRAAHFHQKLAVVAEPKLDQFPSPRPLSEQEKILASYVMRFHDEAVLVARARTEALQREREEETRGSGSGWE